MGELCCNAQGSAGVITEIVFCGNSHAASADAEVNKLINPNMEYIYFRAENVALSSSMVKELHSFGLDVSSYVPAAVLEML